MTDWACEKLLRDMAHDNYRFYKVERPSGNVEDVDVFARTGT